MAEPGKWKAGSPIVEITLRDLSTITNVRQALADLQQPIEDCPGGTTNPVAEFNSLYHAITTDISYEAFARPEYLESLDVHFARRYMAALGGWSLNGPCPPTWSALFDQRDTGKVHPLQARVAGVCAHICGDLAAALVETLSQLEYDDFPADDSPERSDYLQVNGIFKKEIPILRQQAYDHRWQDWLDHLNGHFGDGLQSEVVDESRAVAWRTASSWWPRRIDLDSLVAQLQAKVGLFMADLLLKPAIGHAIQVVVPLVRVKPPAPPDA